MNLKTGKIINIKAQNELDATGKLVGQVPDSREWRLISKSN